MSDDESGYKKKDTFSFGIELELIILFHENAIKPYITNPKASILKLKHDDGLQDTQRDALRDKLKLKRQDYPTVTYKSWAIENDGSSYCENPNAAISRGDTCHSVRGYQDEPLKLARDRLNRSGVPFLEKLELYWDPTFRKHTRTSYNQWMITGDPTLEGLESREKADALLSHGPRSTRKRTLNDSSFDSCGIELVSPVYGSKNDIKVLVSQIKALPGAMEFDGTGNSISESGFIALTTDVCALHVHVGHSDNRPIDTAVLRQLAWLLIVYEHEIVRLISPGRRAQIYGIPGTEDQNAGLPLRSQVMSNREQFCWEPVIDAVYQREVMGADGILVTKPHTFLFKSLENIKKVLLPEDQFDNEEEDFDDLIKHIMCETKYRGRLVSFIYARRASGGRTIEFRQHEGTLDPEAIQNWVLFCVGLVDLAWYMANESFGLQADNWDDIWIEDLFKIMDLPQKARRYFRKKMRSMGDNGKLRSLDGQYQEVDQIEELSMDS